MSLNHFQILCTDIFFFVPINFAFTTQGISRPLCTSGDLRQCVLLSVAVIVSPQSSKNFANQEISSDRWPTICGRNSASRQVLSKINCNHCLIHDHIVTFHYLLVVKHIYKHNLELHD